MVTALIICTSYQHQLYPAANQLSSMGGGDGKPDTFSPTVSLSLCVCVHHTILGSPGVVWPRGQWPLCPKHAPRPSRPRHFAARAVHHQRASMLAKRGPAAATTLAIDTDLTALTSEAHFPPVLRSPPARSTCGNHAHR